MIDHRSDTSRTDEDTAAGATVSPKLLEQLVCPITLQNLVYDAKRQELISERAGLAFPIRDGIPILVEDEARSLGD